MAKLTTAARKKLPAKDFAGPDRSYPVEDKSHARNAKARAAQAVSAGRMSKAEEKKIDARADRKLDKRGEANRDRAADGVVARLSRPKPVR